MATSSIANRNNFIRWNKVTGLYKEGQLQDFKLPSAEDLKTLADWNEGTISSNTWNDVKISNGVCIAVGDSGVISRSLDGENFIDITSPDGEEKKGWVMELLFSPVDEIGEFKLLKKSENAYD